MGDEDTKASHPVADATEAAPSEDATQGIYAWSESSDDDSEVVAVHRRSWKLPVTLAALATAAAVITGIVMVWPKAKPPLPEQKPAAAPVVPAPPPQNPRPLQRDSRGIPILPKDPTPEEKQAVVAAIFDLRGIPYENPFMAGADADSVCAWLGSGHYTEQQLADHVAATHPGLDDQFRIGAFTAAAVGTYCRQYLYLLANAGNGATS
jgi:hypothetical protein